MRTQLFSTTLGAFPVGHACRCVVSLQAANDRPLGFTGGYAWHSGKGSQLISAVHDPIPAPDLAHRSTAMFAREYCYVGRSFCPSRCGFAGEKWHKSLTIAIIT